MDWQTVASTLITYYTANEQVYKTQKPKGDDVTHSILWYLCDYPVELKYKYRFSSSPGSRK
jgi:hypothetical protein